MTQDSSDIAIQIRDGQSNDGRVVEAEKSVPPPLTVTDLRAGVSEAVEQFKRQVFKSLQAAGTESLLVYLILLRDFALLRDFKVIHS